MVRPFASSSSVPTSLYCSILSPTLAPRYFFSFSRSHSLTPVSSPSHNPYFPSFFSLSARGLLTPTTYAITCRSYLHSYVSVFVAFHQRYHLPLAHTDPTIAIMTLLRTDALLIFNGYNFWQPRMSFISSNILHQRVLLIPCFSFFLLQTPRSFDARMAYPGPSTR